VGKVPAMGQIKTHDAVVGLQQPTVHIEVRRGTREGLNVDTPLGRVQVEGLQGTLLAEGLAHVDELVSAIIPEDKKQWKIGPTVPSSTKQALRQTWLQGSPQSTYSASRSPGRPTQPAR